MKTLVFGGSASGKSSFAESLVCKKNHPLKIYLATLDRNSGGDTAERIKRHEILRSGKSFLTVESPEKTTEMFFSDIISRIEEIKNAAHADSCAILLEDIGNLVARVVFSDFSLVHEHQNDDFFAGKIISFIEKLFSLCSDIVLVSNDIFLEKLAASDDGMRAYLVTLSRVNVFLSHSCYENFRVVAGQPMFFSASW
ncbi:MAG: bifunctional adenosylcobinamide kinase/adenosylcobinamide-phosphate guanylyltransferase [Treponema sp.]|nr:bifunctional adenosylcobinamide kinase/adenosylcobinamide-phosphate guanylyltransferase [Treponema sp.]